jgi:hypothetical protein
MRLVLSLCASTFLTLSLAACGGDGGEHYDTLEDCVADHVSEGLSEPHAITHCLVDFPDLHSDFANLADCLDFVTANGGYPDSRDDACADYFVETDMVDAGP